MTPERELAREVRLTELLGKASTENVLERYRRAVLIDTNEIVALRLGVELNRRGIAPVFRLPGERATDFHRDVQRIFALADLAWLRCRYPGHVPQWERLRGVFSMNPDVALKAARFALWNGHRRPGQLVKVLGLTDFQIQELAWLIPGYVGTRRQQFVGRVAETQSRIAEALRRSRDRRSPASQMETASIRAQLWLCGQLADWKPQRCADLFSMMPNGKRLPRNVVARHLDAIRRGLTKKRV